MKKILNLLIITSLSLFGEMKIVEPPKVTKEDLEKYTKKSDEWKKELSDLMKKDKDTKIDNKKFLDMLETGKDGTFMGKKLPTMRLPERKIENIDDPLKRAELVNKSLINDNSKEISQKSINMSKLYKFVATYGIAPRKDGTLENEQELYKLIESKKIKLSSKRVKESETKIKPVNHFLKLSR